MGTKEAPDKQFKRSSVWRVRRSFTLHVSRFMFLALRFSLFGLLVSVLSGNFAYSQDITVSADVTPKIISLNETATLRVMFACNSFRQSAAGEYCTAKVKGIAGVQCFLRRVIQPI